MYFHAPFFYNVFGIMLYGKDMKMKTKIGIIGVGNMGRSHAKQIFGDKVPHMELGAVCDNDPAQLDWCTENLPGIAQFASAEELMDSGLVDSVLIAVPHYDHEKYTIAALERGLHVYCEKPVAVYTKQSLAMNEVAKKSGKVFAVGFQQRTNPAFGKIREMVQSGELGHIKKVVWIVTDWYRPQAYHDSSSWRSSWKGEGGGTIVNQNPHNIDLFQWMFGMPDEVMSVIDYGKYYNIEVDDDVNVIMRYNSGTIGVYTTSTGEIPGTNRLEVSADMGKLVYENNKLTFWKNEISERELNEKNRAAFVDPKTEKIEIEIPALGMHPHCALLENFALAISEGTPLLAPGVDGINELTLANSFYYSDWLGQKWVKTAEFDHEGFYRALTEKIEKSTHVKNAVRKAEVNMENSF